MSESKSSNESETRIQQVSNSRDSFEDPAEAVGQYSRRKDAREYYEELKSAKKHGEELSEGQEAFFQQMKRREKRDHPDTRRMFNRWKSAWKRGEVLPKDGIFELIQDYCWRIYCTSPPEKALAELLAIREQYGDEKGQLFDSYRISKMIAGCYASRRDYEEAKRELRKNAHESFNLMRRFTDFCLAIGSFEDVIDALQSDANGQRYVHGRYFSEQLIIAHISLGRIPEAISRLQKRLVLGSRNQVLVNNIWSLKLQTGARPEAKEILATPSAKLRSFGKKNLAIVAESLDTLLATYEMSADSHLLRHWSNACRSRFFRSRLEVFSIRGARNVPSEIETDVEHNDFTRCPTAQSFIMDITRLAEDLTKSAGKPVSITDLGDFQSKQLLNYSAFRLPEHVQNTYIVPTEFSHTPFEFDSNYRPPSENVDRFKALSWLIPDSYSRRNSDPDALDETIRLCKEQISLSYDMAHFDYLSWRYEANRRKRNANSFEIISDDEKSRQQVMHKGEVSAETGMHEVAIGSERKRVWYQRTSDEREKYLERFHQFSLGRTHVGYRRIAIILEQQGDYETALLYAVRARAEGWPGDWDKRISRLLKKTNKE